VIVRLAGAAYEIPTAVVSVDDVMASERDRVEACLSTISPAMRQRATAELGIERVHCCTPEQPPYSLMRSAAVAALSQAGAKGAAVDLILDYSTCPGMRDLNAPLAHRLSSDLGAEMAQCISFKFGGCAGMHLAIQHALALMKTHANLRTALLVAADSPPPGSRSLMPITVQGDAGSAVVLRADGDRGPAIVGTEVATVGQFHRVITLEPRDDGTGLELRVDAAQLEECVVPVYFLQFHRLVTRVLAAAGIHSSDVAHVIYANLSASDRRGFMGAMGFPCSMNRVTSMAEYGHAFASDPVINYCDLVRDGQLSPGQWLLFAAAGIGFSWGVTLART
jgi:3-oxoacyl-[acyl-carrier-protein] synthase III